MSSCGSLCAEDEFDRGLNKLKLKTAIEFLLALPRLKKLKQISYKKEPPDIEWLLK